MSNIELSKKARDAEVKEVASLFGTNFLVNGKYMIEHDGIINTKPSGLRIPKYVYEIKAKLIEDHQIGG